MAGSEGTRKCQMQVSWLHEQLGKSEPSSITTLPAHTHCSLHLVQLAALGPFPMPRRPHPVPLLCSPSPSACPFISAKCRGPEFMSHLPHWTEAWGAVTSGFTAQRSRLELGSSLASQSRATQETHGKWHCIHTGVLEWPLSALRTKSQAPDCLVLSSCIGSWLLSGFLGYC